MADSWKFDGPVPYPRSERGEVRCIDCGEFFFPIEMDAGDPDRKGFCQACADAAREYERTLI